MRIKKHKVISNFLWVLGLFSLLLVLMNKWEMVGALWMVTFCLLPSMWLAMGTSYLGLKIYCATVLITQIVTLPSFYLQPDSYRFSNHRPFGFGALDALQAFLILGLFLWLLAFLVKIIECVYDSPLKQNAVANAMPDMDRRKEILSIHVPNHNIIAISILCLMAISLPVKLWMFDMGVGLVGAPPPELPYRLSGILFYLFNYLVPFAVAYLYIKTKRNSLLLALTISVYAVLIGALSVSKSVVFIPIASIVAFAWLDRRPGILICGLILSGIGVLIVVGARAIVHVADGLDSFTELGSLGTLMAVIVDFSWSPKMLLVFVDIASRFEGFQSMYLASQFDADAVGGAWNIFLKVSSFGQWGVVDHDAIHLEYLGYTYPKGFYGVAATFNSWMMMAVNKNNLMMLPFVIYAVTFLVVFEKTLKRVARKYSSPPAIEQSILFFAILWFYTGPANLTCFLFLAVSMIFSVFPVIVVRRKPS